MTYLLIANEEDLQEHKRDIAKRAQPSVPCICSSSLDFQFTKDFLGKLGYSRKNPRSRGWGYTFLLPCIIPPGNSKIESQARPMEISNDFFFHHHWKFHFFFSWSPGISIIFQNGVKFLTKALLRLTAVWRKLSIFDYSFSFLYCIYITFTKKSVLEPFFLVLFI